MANKYIKRHSILVVNMNVQIKTTMTKTYTKITMANKTKTTQKLPTKYTDKNMSNWRC